MDFNGMVSFKKNDITVKLEIITSSSYIFTLSSTVIKNNKMTTNYSILKSIGFTENEISIIKEANKTRLFTEPCFKLTKKGMDLYRQANEKLENIIINNTNETLTPLEILLVKSKDNLTKKDITNDIKRYVTIDYESNCQDSIKDNIKIFVEIIKNHIDLIDFINIKSNKSIKGINIFYKTLQKEDKLILQIKKYKFDKNLNEISYNAVPLVELVNKNDFEINESIFTNGLKYGIVLSKNLFSLNNDILELIKELKLKAKTEILKGNSNPLTKEELKIINLPDTIETTEKQVKNYHLDKENMSYVLNKTGEQTNQDVTYNNITYNDLIYFIERILLI